MVQPSLSIILLVSTMSGLVDGEFSPYESLYENMASQKGETYSFIINYLLAGVESLKGVHVRSDLSNCLYDLSKFYKAYQRREIWALKMFDSSTQLPSGFLQGNIGDLGNFEECININTRSNNITGQHCFVYFYFYGENLPALANTYNVVNGICVPSSCTKQHIQKIFHKSSYKLEQQPAVTNCQTKKSINPPMGSLERTILLCFGTLVVFLLIGTGYDIYLRNYHNSRQNEEEIPSLESIRECKGGKMKYQRCLMAFSCLRNGEELLQVDSMEKSIKCLYGLRFISACFILSIHRMLFDPQPFSNFFALENEMRKWYRAIQLNAYLFVDIFFVMSGLVLSYRYSSHIKSGAKLNLVHYYLHRYIRLTPPLLACVMLDLMLGMLCNGPYCQQVLIRNRDRCINNGVYTLTYLNNLIYSSRKCVAHSWYLSADMQIYALAPILFFFLKKSRRTVPYLLLVCLSTSILITFVISYRHGFKSGYMHYDTLRGLDGKLIYYPFYTRMGPWFIGFGLGLILQSFNNMPYRLGKRFLTYGWLLSVSCILIAIFGVYPFNQIEFQHDRITDSIFKALYRNLFGVGFAWIIYACYTGHCDFLNRFMSCAVMQILGKLSYSFYLIHPFVILLQFRSVSQPRTYSDFSQGSILLGDICYSTVFAVILHLAVEAPSLKLERIFFEKSKNGGAKVKKPCQG